MILELGFSNITMFFKKSHNKKLEKQRQDSHIFLMFHTAFEIPIKAQSRLVMTTARRQLIDAESTPFYHVINRCVRRAFLCGEDALSGRSYEHRRGWIVDKIRQLSSVFCIDVCAYAVMSNHYHLVLKIDLAAQQALSPFEVIERWTGL